MTLLLLTTGGIFLLAALFIWKFPPKNINGLYGYRTPSSMATKERWEFAQKHGAGGMAGAGVLFCLTGLALIPLKLDELYEILLGSLIIILVSILIIARTEKAIRKKFGKLE